MTASQSQQSPQKFVRCPSCSERLGVREQDAGRRARCTKCGRVFVIVDGASDSDAASNLAAAVAAEPATPASPPEPPAPEWVSFECSLCQTRLSARVAEVGNKLACPDCGRKNVIPPPPKPKKARVPAAMGGDQLGVWGVDVKTWEPGFETGALLHPVLCRVCQTRMYATDEQVGQELKCPDCGAAAVAKASTPRKPGELSTPASDEYELDPASAPTPRPSPTPRPAPKPAALVETEKRIEARAHATAKRPKRREELPKYDQPKMPRVPLVRGVLPMLFSGEILQRWVLLSLWLSGVAWLGSQVALASAGGMGAIAGVCFLAIACVMGVVWLTSAAPLWLAMITESSEGHDALQDPPRWGSFEWFSETWYVAVAAAGCAIPASVAAKSAEAIVRAFDDASVGGLDWQWLAAIGGGVWLLCFPVVLLSSLDQGSPLGAFSPRLLRSLGQCFVPWAVFYFTSIFWLASFAFAIAKAVTAPMALWSVPPLAVAASLVYMRLLGRLAWWLSEAIDDPHAGEVEERDDAAAAHPHLAAALSAARIAKREEAAAAVAPKR